MTGIIKRERGPRVRGLGWPMRDLFGELFEAAGWDAEQHSLTGAFVPPIDISEDENGLALAVELPGIAREDLDVRIEDGVLIIHGEKKQTPTPDDACACRVERRYGQFTRSVRLPEHMDVEAIEAAYADGVLTLSIPKTEVSKPRTIKIK
jgi:HSP20 family protein